MQAVWIFVRNIALNRRTGLFTMVLLFVIMAGSGGILLFKVYHAGEVGNVSNQVSYYYDENNNLSVSEAFQKMKQFTKNSETAIHIPRTGVSLWLLVEPRLWQGDGSTEDLALFFDHPNFIGLDAYVQQGDGHIQRLKLNKQFISPYFPISKKFSEEEAILIKANNTVSSYKIGIVGLNDYFTLQVWLMTYMLFSIGIIFALFILDVSLALILKEANFFYYALFLAIAQLYMYTSSGLSRMSIGLENYGFFAFGFATLAGAMLFIYRFIDIREAFPKIAKSYLGLIGLSIMAIPFAIICGKHQQMIIVLYNLLLCLGFVVSIWALVTLIYFRLRKHKISSFFLIGSMIQASTIPILIFASLGWVHHSSVYELTYMIAGSINAVYFTLGIIQQLKDVREKNALFYELATTDRLTGANNRYDFDTRLSERMEYAKRNEVPLSLMIFDIDKFKGINDTYGHDVGDQVLKELVLVVKRQLRTSEKLYRWGGEEFAILIEDTGLEQVAEFGERIRATVESHIFKKVQQITVSIGISELLPEDTAPEWFKRVDQALYQAKNSGRNKVNVFSRNR